MDTATQLIIDKDTLREKFQRVKTAHQEYVNDVHESRRIRLSRVSVDSMREQKKLAANETYIAVRVIDENIVRDMPTYMAYIKNAARMAIFKPRDGSVSPLMPRLESWFTSLLCYDDPPWECDYIRWIDGALCHGQDFIEVLYDVSKPGHVAVNHVGVDQLIYDLNYDDIQQSPLVARGYRLSPIEIEAYLNSGTFEPTAAAKLLEYIKQTSDRARQSFDPNDAPSCYKIYVKHQGTVYFCWYSPTIQAFLTDPQPFYNGLTRQVTQQVQVTAADGFTIVPQEQTSLVPVNEQVYPFVALRKRITEDKNQRNIGGHAHDSYYLQEAATSLTSALVNGTLTASNVMWAPDDSAGLEGSSVKQIDFEIKKNAVWSRPMRAFFPAYPDPMLMNTLQHLETRNGIATSQTAFAVANRKDSRKTATELQMAQQQTSQVNSIQVLHLSIAIRELCIRAFAIIQSEVMSNNLDLPADLPRELVLARYTLSSAGDVDYIQRMELISSMQQDWPILSQTPVGPLLLEDYIRARYPNAADRYVSALRQQQQDTALITGLAQVVQELATDESGNLTPEAQANANDLAALQQQVATRLGTNVGSVAQPSANAAAPS